jgi:lipid-A-disaccharide synthase
MALMAEHFPEYQFVVSKVKWLPASLYQSHVKNKRITIIEGNTYALLRHAKAAVVTSGTATLETALWNVPQVVCYKGSFVSYLITKSLVCKHLKYISLVNLILDKPAVKELIQFECNPKRLKEELEKIVNQNEIITNMQADYQKLKHILGDAGASDNAANLIVNHDIR